MTKPSIKTLRNRVVHGWAFRSHTIVERIAIRYYLETGEITENLPSVYVKLHNALVLDVPHE